MTDSNDRQFSNTEHPGDEWRHAICDMCGVKRFVKDMVAIEDKYNRLNGLYVCAEHADPVHPQDIPHWVQEQPVDDPRTIRTRPSDEFVVNEDSDTLPGAPEMLIATLSPLTDVVILTWQGPENTGSGAIIGYLIERTIQTSGEDFTVLVSNTNTSSTMYIDTTADTDEFYYYRIAVVSDIGTGPYSNIAPFPYDLNIETAYIVGENGIGIMGENGIYLAGES